MIAMKSLRWASTQSQIAEKTIRNFTKRNSSRRAQRGNSSLMLRPSKYSSSGPNRKWEKVCAEGACCFARPWRPSTEYRRRRSETSGAGEPGFTRRSLCGQTRKSSRSRGSPRAHLANPLNRTIAAIFARRCRPQNGMQGRLLVSEARSRRQSFLQDCIASKAPCHLEHSFQTVASAAVGWTSGRCLPRGPFLAKTPALPIPEPPTT